jgi:hypothetical protein
VIIVGVYGIDILHYLERSNYEGVPMADVQPNYDDTDVELALTNTDAGDGPEDELPGSDFEGFPEDDVENDHDGDNEPAVEENDPDGDNVGSEEEDSQ